MPPKQPPPQPMSLTVLLKTKLKDPQFYWFLGHVATLYNFVLYNLLSVFTNGAVRYYNRCLLSIIFTYSIVLYQFYKSQKLGIFKLQFIKTNDNAQYWLVAAFLWLLSGTKVLGSATFSFAIFSAFHCMSYFKSKLLPYMNFVQPQTRALLNTGIDTIVNKYNEQALFMSSNTEWMSLVQVAVGLPFSLLRNIRGAPLQIVLAYGYLAFFKLRYITSKYSQAVVSGSVYKVDAFVNSGRLPPQLVGAWFTAKEYALRIYASVPV